MYTYLFVLNISKRIGSTVFPLSFYPGPYQRETAVPAEFSKKKKKRQQTPSLERSPTAVFPQLLPAQCGCCRCFGPRSWTKIYPQLTVFRDTERVITERYMINKYRDCAESLRTRYDILRLNTFISVVSRVCAPLFSTAFPSADPIRNRRQPSANIPKWWVTVYLRLFLYFCRTNVDIKINRFTETKRKPIGRHVFNVIAQLYPQCFWCVWAS